MSSTPDPTARAAARIAALRARLREANYQYYVLQDPQLPDAEWDRLFHELKTLEAEHPSSRRPTRRRSGSGRPRRRRSRRSGTRTR